MAKKFFLLVVFAVAMISIKAQYPFNTIADSLLTKHLQIINNSIDSFLYNPNCYISGRFYYPRGMKDNHPFFLDNNWKSGLVKYKGELFPVPMMKYDIEKDVLVILKIIENLGYSIQLDKRVINEFFIGEHHFISLNDAKIAGYYEELCNSRTRVWTKWTKWDKVDANSVSGIPIYVSDLHFTIQKNNCYFKVKNLKELLDVYSDRKQELKRFKRENKLSFRKDKAGTIKKLTEQYDMLNS